MGGTSNPDIRKREVPDICQGLETLMYLKHLSTQADQSVIKAHKPYPSKPNLTTDTGYQGFEFSFIGSHQETEICIGFR